MTSIPGPLGGRTRRGRTARVRATWFLRQTAAEAVVRGFDFGLAAVLLGVLSPFLVARAVLAYARTGRVLERTRLVGRFRRPFDRLTFTDDAPGRRLPALWNVLRGDLGWAGPRPLRPDEAARVEITNAARFSVRPGIVSLHGVRARVGLAHDTEGADDTEFVYSETLRSDVGLLARATVGSVLSGSSETNTPPVLEFFGVEVVNTTMDEALDWLVHRGRDSDRSSLVTFVNPHCLNVAYVDDEYRRALDRSARILPDGIGIHLGCRLLGTGLLDNVNGTDLFPRLCERLASQSLSLFLLGGAPGVAREAAAAMIEQYPGLSIAGTRDGFFKPEDAPRIVAKINDSGAAFLLVGMGVPRQEKWLAEQHDALRVPVRLAVGGLFDFYSGRIPRAPAWLREIGLEWAWRLAQEPGRMWRRYVIGNPLFLYRVWRHASRTSQRGSS